MSRSEFRKMKHDFNEYLDSVSDEELMKDLIKAGYNFYSRIHTEVLPKSLKERTSNVRIFPHLLKNRGT